MILVQLLLEGNIYVDRFQKQWMEVQGNFRFYYPWRLLFWLNMWSGVLVDRHYITMRGFDICVCLRLWLSSSTCCSDFLHVALTYYGCLLDCGGNCGRLLDLMWSFRFYYVFIHYLMCLIWNGCILSYWLNSRKLHVSVNHCVSKLGQFLIMLILDFMIPTIFQNENALDNDSNF